MKFLSIFKTLFILASLSNVGSSWASGSLHATVTFEEGTSMQILRSSSGKPEYMIAPPLEGLQDGKLSLPCLILNLRSYLLDEKRPCTPESPFKIFSKSISLKEPDWKDQTIEKFPGLYDSQRIFYELLAFSLDGTKQLRLFESSVDVPKGFERVTFNLSFAPGEDKLSSSVSINPVVTLKEPAQPLSE